MSKTNPLFVDSTKFQGDIIPCRIELSRVFLYPGESIIVRITDRRGKEDDIVLQPEEDIYVARIRLRHQEKFGYQFCVRNQEKILWASEKSSFQGTYLVTNVWQPIPELDHGLNYLPKAPPESIPTRSLSKRNNYDGNLLSAIINKWGF